MLSGCLAVTSERSGQGQEMTEKCIRRGGEQQLKGSDRSDSKKVSQAKSSVNKSPT